jgi:hypothetical protein
VTANLALFREGMKELYDIRNVVNFTHDGVRGGVIDGVTKARPAVSNWRPGIQSLLFVFYTPKGRTSLECQSTDEAFAHVRGSFEQVARAVTLPR